MIENLRVKIVHWKCLEEKDLNLTATLEIKVAYSNADFMGITAPTDCDSGTQRFDTVDVENVIELVMQYNPNGIIVIKTTISVGYTESVRKEYGSKNVIFSPEFLCKSKARYDNVYPKFSVAFLWVKRRCSYHPANANYNPINHSGTHSKNLYFRKTLDRI